jgi:hypothetical protein
MQQQRQLQWRWEQRQQGHLRSSSISSWLRLRQLHRAMCCTQVSYIPRAAAAAVHVLHQPLFHYRRSAVKAMPLSTTEEVL